MAKDCPLCELKASKINEWIYGSPTGSNGSIVLNWKGKNNKDLIIGCFTKTDLTKATTEASGHGIVVDGYADRYYFEMLPYLEQKGDEIYGPGNWGFVYHYPDGFTTPSFDIEYILSSDKRFRDKAIKCKKDKDKLEAEDHYYVEIIQSGSIWSQKLNIRERENE